MLPFSLKRLRALLRERGVGRVEILKRGSALEPGAAAPGPAAGRRARRRSLVLTRVAGAPTVLLCRRHGRRLAWPAWRDRAPRRRRC